MMGTSALSERAHEVAVFERDSAYCGYPFGLRQANTEGGAAASRSLGSLARHSESFLGD